MQTIEFESAIDNNGNLHLPEQYQYLYGHSARFVTRFHGPMETKSPNPSADTHTLSGQDSQHPHTPRGKLSQVLLMPALAVEDLDFSRVKDSAREIEL